MFSLPLHSEINPNLPWLLSLLFPALICLLLCVLQGWTGGEVQYTLMCLFTLLPCSWYRAGPHGWQSMTYCDSSYLSSRAVGSRVYQIQVVAVRHMKISLVNRLFCLKPLCSAHAMPWSVSATAVPKLPASHAQAGTELGLLQQLRTW